MNAKWLTVVTSGILLLLVIPLASCAPTTGDIQGRLIGAYTEEPLAGAAIILGLVTGESECTLQSDLIASVGGDGAFALTDVPAGIYVVFYNPSGEAEETWQEIDGLNITNYALLDVVGKPINQYEGVYSLITNELYDTLLAGDEIKFWYDLTAISDPERIIESIEGCLALASAEYGIIMQFEDVGDGEPTMLEVKAGETTNVEIMALVTEWPW